MSEICNICGLPKELCVCSTLVKEGQKILVKAVKRRFGSPTTVIQGIDSAGMDMKALVKQLKERLACGGTFKAGAIELMGDHRKKVKEALAALGFAADSIEVKEQIE